MYKEIKVPKSYNGFIGVRPPGIPLKQEVLLFDTIAMYHIEDILTGIVEISAHHLSELQFLYDKGLIVLAPIWIKERPDNENDYKILSKLQSNDKPELYDELITRLLCVELDVEFNADALPLLYSNISFVPSFPTKTNIAQIVLSSFPIPEESVSWEQIIDFKANEKARDNLLKLRGWMRTVSCSDKKPNELKEELEILLNEHERYMNYHKMKYRLGIFESLIKIPFEITENIVKLKWSKIPETLLSIQHKRIDLMEAEFKAPHQEVAYIHKVRNRFLT